MLFLVGSRGHTGMLFKQVEEGRFGRKSRLLSNGKVGKLLVIGV